eukprot:1383222-Amorphochlora_amoeboformis.AAC.1
MEARCQGKPSEKWSYGDTGDGGGGGLEMVEREDREDASSCPSHPKFCPGAVPSMPRVPQNPGNGRDAHSTRKEFPRAMGIITKGLTEATEIRRDIFR